MATVLSAEELVTLRAELAGPAYAGLGAAARFAALNAPAAVPNPTPRGQVPTPFTVSQVLGGLSPASLAKLPGVAFLPAVRDSINLQDRPACGLWAQVLAAGGLITPTEEAAIMALLGATQPDPAWPATVPGPAPRVRLFGPRTWTYPDGRTVDYIPLEDVEAAS